jgi:hypothetical protein
VPAIDEPIVDELDPPEADNQQLMEDVDEPDVPPIQPAAPPEQARRRQDPAVPAARPLRARQRPAYLRDYVGGEAFDDEALMCQSAVDIGGVPTNVQEAMQDPNWKQAMTDEYQSLNKNGVWSLTSLPNGRKAIGGRWHFVIKHGPNGEVVKYKARYVAKGFTQVYGRDYQETYSPTVKLSTIRCLLACAAQLQCGVQQMDIKTAYLNAEIDEEIYMRQPEGFTKTGKQGQQLVCKLHKSIYGLKQSGRNWYHTISSYLYSLGFNPSINGPCLFVKVTGGTYYYVCIWVDDIIYFSVDPNFVNEFKEQIEKRFTISDLTPLHWFLGMKLECTPGRIEVSQRQYVDALLHKFGMQDCKAVSTTIAEKRQLTKTDCPKDGSEEQVEMKDLDYRGLVGSLNYLATTSRPDVAFVAHSLSSYLENPGREHWTAGKHVLRYLQGTKDFKLVFQHDPDGLVLRGYADADYAGHIDTRRSTSGHCFSLQRGSGCVSWSSKLQSTVATSTAEAELNAAMAAAQEAVHLQELLSSMGYPQQPPTRINVDNQACIAITRNPVQQTKTKHYAIKLHYTRELVLGGTIDLVYVPTDENNADVFTKGLGKTKTLKFTQAVTGTEKS